MVPTPGLEPGQLSPLPPQDSVSTNSTTSAFISLLYCSNVTDDSKDYCVSAGFYELTANAIVPVLAEHLQLQIEAYLNRR